MSEADGLEPLVNALRRQLRNRTERIEELESRMAELEELVDPDPGKVDYDQLTPDQKVHRVRKHLAQEAAKGNRPTMTYDDVKWLFDGHPSPGHCYDLMERGAEADGYVYETGGHGSGQKRIRVNLDAVNDDALIHAANNASSDTPA